jgi:hypothetical protein
MSIEKLKCRLKSLNVVLYLGTLYQPNTPEDSWNPFTSYLALRIFLAKIKCGLGSSISTMQHVIEQRSI